MFSEFFALFCCDKVGGLQYQRLCLYGVILSSQVSKTPV